LGGSDCSYSAGNGDREDDGLLTDDEIGTLQLNADWVVLSACNAAGPVGRGLSGLARAGVELLMWRATRLPGR
jgi:CHAT domain-containing protein